MIGGCAVYITILIGFIIRKKKNKEIKDIVNSFAKEEDKKDYYSRWKRKIFDIMLVRDKKQKKILSAVFNIVLLIIFGISIYMVGAISLVVIVGIVSSYIAKENIDKLVDKSGIRYIPITNEFLDVFIPAITSGKSNSQAMLAFINQYEDNEVLNVWWADRSRGMNDNRFETIVEIYDMTMFDEEHGIDDSLPVIKEMQENMNKKQEFYDEFVAKIGETSSIELSYVGGLPLLLLMTLSNTRQFWYTFPGLLCAVGLGVMFVLFRFLSYKLRVNTIKKLF